MRKTTLTIILVFVVLSALLSSCFLARGILGVKTPSPKTEKQVLKKARKFHFDEFPMLFTTDTGTIRYWVTDRLRTVDSASNKFDPLIFKHEDMVIPVETSTGCTAYSFTLVHSLSDSTQYHTDPNKPLSWYINSQCVINFDSTAFYTDIADADFVVLIYWATYEGVFNKPKNKRLAEEIVRKNEQDSLNIKAYYVNFDKRENIKLCTSTLKGR